MDNKPISPNLEDGFPVSASREAMVAVLRAYGTLQRLMEPYFSQFDLTPPQFQLMCIAHRFGQDALTQRRLAREMYVSFPNITVLLKRMEKKGLIERNGNPRDRREKYVRLTEAGEKLLRRVWQVHQKQMDMVMEGLSVAERKQMTALLNKMTAAHRIEGE